MDIKILETIYRVLAKDSLTFLINGHFSDKMTENIIGISEFSISGKEDMKKMRKKISFLIAESFQNIVRHGLPAEQIASNQSKSGMFFTKNSNNVNYITTANPITAEQKEHLQPLLARVNELSPDELKQLYHDVLNHGFLSQKGGAGLGLIEMARKSGKKLEYDFVPVDATHSLFYLMITTQSAEPSTNMYSLQMAESFHKTIKQGEIFILYKGDFSRESILPILNLMEENLTKNQEIPLTRKKVLIILIELLQNISKHGFVNEDGNTDGILTIGSENKKYVICAGNLIKKDKVSLLKEELMRIAKMNREDLISHYKNTLRNGKTNASGGGGLGLLEAIKESADQPEFSIESYSEISSLYLLKLTV